MATYTTNYELTKPAYSDQADIGVINADLDAIDAQMKTNADAAASAMGAATEAQRLAGEAQEAADNKLGPESPLPAENLTGTVPTSCLPAYVDDVVEYANRAAFPATGEAGKIYVDLATNLAYRWGGSAYVEISPSIALGETSGTAYRGDRGAAAYAHGVTNKGNALTGKPTGNQTPAFGGTFQVSQVVTNAEGHVTSMNDRTVTIPATQASSSTLGLVKVDAALDGTSANPVQNKAVSEAIDDLQAQIDAHHFPTLDEETGRYVNVGQWLDNQRDGLIFTVRIPKYSASTGIACTKRDANAGLVVTPSTADAAGRDDYQQYLTFKGWDANGGAEDSGAPFATGIDGFDRLFDRYGGNGNVWRLCPVLFWKFDEQAAYIDLSISDTQHDGFSPQPGAKLPDGTLRPFMLYAKYAGCMYGGKYASVSGQKAQNRNISHDSLINLTRAVGAGYSGKSIADDWYVKVMFLMKYAAKSSQSVYAGCTGYTLQCAPTVGETGVRRVIVSNANAAAIDVGSAMQFGTHTGNNDRNTASNYDIFDGARVTKKEAYDANNTAVYFDTPSTFNTATSYYLSTTPWRTGALDGVKGADGTITAAGRTNSHEPFLLQGIECAVGFYEVLGDVIINAAEIGGALVCELHVCYDSANEATSLTADYTDTGLSLPTSQTAGWLYTCDVGNAGGLLVGVGQGANTSAGMGDGNYQNVVSSKGLREFLGWGYLDNWGLAGVFCVISNCGLGLAWWYVGSRLSATGRAAA